MAKLDQISIGGTDYDFVPEVAPIFDATTAYEIGDWVIKDAVLYRFTTAHAAGAWDANQVEEITVGEEVEKALNKTVDVDKTLTIDGAAADSKTVGDEITSLKADVTENRQNIALKLDKNQGTANAGKYLKVQSGGQVVPVDLIDNSLLVETMAADSKATGDALNTKLNKNQGANNSGKYLKVGADGNVETAGLDVTTDKTLSIADKAADAKVVGDELKNVKTAISQKISGDIVSFSDGVEGNEILVSADINAVQNVEPIEGAYGAIAGFNGATITVSSSRLTEDETYDITWEPECGTIYKGKIDFSSGEITVTHRFIDVVQEDFGYFSSGGESGNYYTTIRKKMYGANIPKRDSMQTWMFTHGSCGSSLISGYYSRTYENTKDYIVVVIGNLPSQLNNKALITAYLNELKENGEPMQIVYELQTPLTYKINPVKILELDGNNYIKTSLNNVTVLKLIDLGTVIDSVTNRSTEKELYISEFAQGQYNSSGIDTTKSNRVTTKTVVTLPYGDKTKLTFHCPQHLKLLVGTGRVSQTVTTSSGWFRDGESYECVPNAQYYRIMVGRDDDTDITPTDIEGEDIRITYSHTDGFETPNFYDRSIPEFQTLCNAKFDRSASSKPKNLPIILHISDPHGDYYHSKNAFDLADLIEANAICISGDIVGNSPYSGAQWLHDLISTHNTLPVLCTGNHDVFNDNYTDAMVYDYLMGPSAEKIENANETTYYYVDIPSVSLRIISADIYQYGGSARSNTHMTDTQLAYICNALKSCPEGYGILLVSHTPEHGEGMNHFDADYPDFYRTYNISEIGQTYPSHYDIVGKPLYDLIDAFISRTSIDKTYTQTGSPSSFRINDDFASVPNSVEFIAHITGHFHSDFVQYLPTENKQLMLNIATVNSTYGGSAYPYLNDGGDLVKNVLSKSQDTINVYTIDRSRGTVQITRFGSTKTIVMKDREYMEIPYR